MPINLTFSNYTNCALTLQRYAPDFADSVQISQALQQTLEPSASAHFVTDDSAGLALIGTGAQSVTIVWEEPRSGTLFGFCADYPLSLAGIHLGDYSWGYEVSPAPADGPSGWQYLNSSDLAESGVAAPVSINDLNKKFVYTIAPNITSDEMAFTIVIEQNSAAPAKSA